MVKSCLIPEWSGRNLVYFSDFCLNTRHLNTRQVKVGYSDVSIIRCSLFRSPQYFDAVPSNLTSKQDIGWCSLCPKNVIKECKKLTGGSPFCTWVQIKWIVEMMWAEFFSVSVFIWFKTIKLTWGAQILNIKLRQVTRVCIIFQKSLEIRPLLRVEY